LETKTKENVKESEKMFYYPDNPKELVSEMRWREKVFGKQCANNYLKASIENEKQQIREINKALKGETPAQWLLWKL
jgi:hypothetical protein